MSKELPNLYESDVVDQELAASPESYRESVEFQKRIGNFTASGNHRLMTGCDMTDMEKLSMASKEWGLKADLLKKAGELGCLVDNKDTIPVILQQIWKHLPKREQDIISADRLPDGAYTYIEEKVVERRTGNLIDTPEVYWMTRGKELEPETVAQFEELIRAFREDTGYSISQWGDDQIYEEVPDLPGVGFTKDALVLINGKRYGFEGKAPKETTHHQYLFGNTDGSIPPLDKHNLREICWEYYWQIITGLSSDRYDGWIFCSYHPAAKEGEKLLIIILDKAEVEEDIRKFKLRARMAVSQRDFRISVCDQLSKARHAQMKQAIKNL